MSCICMTQLLCVLSGNVLTNDKLNRSSVFSFCINDMFVSASSPRHGFVTDMFGLLVAPDWMSNSSCIDMSATSQAFCAIKTDGLLSDKRTYQVVHWVPHRSRTECHDTSCVLCFFLFSKLVNWVMVSLIWSSWRKAVNGLSSQNWWNWIDVEQTVVLVNWTFSLFFLVTLSLTVLLQELVSTWSIKHESVKLDCSVQMTSSVLWLWSAMNFSLANSFIWVLLAIGQIQTTNLVWFLVP